MKTRKTDLFRFVTLRAPQLINKDRRKLGFIEHPGPSESVFLKGISTESEIEESRKIVSEAANSFEPFTKVEQVKQLSEDLWEFSLWLASSKNTIDRASAENHIPSSVLSNDQALHVWDNIFYDILVEKNPYIRQGCLHLLIATNFIENYQEYSANGTTDPDVLQQENEQLQRLANGKVVIHEGFTRLKVKAEPIERPYAGDVSIKQRQAHSGFMAKMEIPTLESIKTELLDLGERYSDDYNDALKKAEEDYHTLLSEQETSESSNEITKSVESIEEASTDKELPSFEFSYPRPLSSKYAKRKLSRAAYGFVEDARATKMDIADAVQLLEKRVSEKQRTAAKIVQKRINEISVNGVKIRKTENAECSFAISFQPTEPTTKSAKPSVDVYFSLNIGENVRFKGGTVKLKIGETEHNFSLSAPIYIEQQNAFFKLNETPISASENEGFELKGEIDLSDEAKFNVYYENVISTINIVGGLALRIIEKSEDTPLYGVNRIGVADFRRVEQELCCYLPGEVSHIENILAKEYKERSTRNLVSTERTVETSSEREHEEITDTATTSRFEMSSEVNDVLEKDRSSNFGFTTGGKGKIPFVGEFNYTTSGNFSMGQSTSESNTSAQSYAEDITKRALERIVQKVSSRRTSKILREFEENNRHGYDNRRGTEHVTGVFRWIDKLYKNRVANYGKRLIYEFMLPEPARFYKEAMIVKLETESASSSLSNSTENAGVLKPEPPSKYGLNSAKDIDRTNYEQFCSIYGVNPTPPEADKIEITESQSKAIGTTDKVQEINFTPKVLLPPNYTCKSFGGYVHYHIKADSKVGHLTVAVGGKASVVPVLEGNGYRELHPNFFDLNYSDSIGIAVGCKQVTSFTLNLKFNCYLKEEIYEQWRLEVYNDILKAYNQQLQAYYDAEEIAAANAQMEEGGEVVQRRENALFNDQMIENELKRLCIEMLTRPFGHRQGNNLYLNGSCDVPELRLIPQLDIYSSAVKFFEQAFDWKLLSSLFYPYYWAKKCAWKDILQTEPSTDHIFQAFLQAGMGRVMVPVREGFEDAVNFYMETGKIWNGTGLVIETDDELHISVADEMTTLDESVEKLEWNTIVPSSLTIVQDKSVKLDQGGLPCCEDEEPTEENLVLKPFGNTLKLISEEESTEEAGQN